MMEGRVAIVTGAAQGIGASIAKRFASEKIKVVVADIKKELGERKVSQIREAGGDALFVEVDVSKKQKRID